jgi:hypothetical protein
MKKLFRTLYGSMLYGTNTEESDVDIKEVYLPDLDSLLLGKAPKNSIKGPKKSKGAKNSSDDTDIEQIPLQVFAQDFMKGQTYALELASVVHSEKLFPRPAIYDDRFVEFCRELQDRFLTSNIQAMCGFAVNQAKIYSDKGDRLNAALAARALYRSFPASHRITDHAEEFNLAAQEVEHEYPEYFRVTTYAVDATGTAMRPCIRLLEKTLPYTNTFATNLATVDIQVGSFGTRAKDAALTGSDWKAMAHAVRIVQEGIDLLSGKSLSFPYDDEYVQYLLSIRAGEHDPDEIRNKISDGVTELTKLSLSSALPKLGPELHKEFDTWLLGWLKRFYNLEAYDEPNNPSPSARS